MSKVGGSLLPTARLRQVDRLRLEVTPYSLRLTVCGRDGDWVRKERMEAGVLNYLSLLSCLGLKQKERRTSSF